jgi:hypothetical protein
MVKKEDERRRSRGVSSAYPSELDSSAVPCTDLHHDFAVGQ